jgi:hypothetical protein
MRESNVPMRRACIVAALCYLAASRAGADIYQRTTSGGIVVQSTTLCPGGAGVSAEPYADLSGAYFYHSALTGVDVRGATGFSPGSSSTANAISPNGTIAGLVLSAADPLEIVRNYSGTSSIPIHVTQDVNIPSGTTLQILASSGVWDSTISFAPGISLSLGGDLELDVGPETDPSTLVGVEIPLFDWSGVTPTGQFNIVNDLAGQGYQWDTSTLYSDGTVVLEAVPEPSTLGPLCVGAIGLLGWAWKKKSSHWES